MNKGESINRKLYGPFKQDLFRHLSGTIVEIGPGTGINFHYFPSGITWLGVEPNEAFHKLLLSQARERSIQATLLTGEADRIPLGDNSADAVICTLVLCSVQNPAAAVAEMKRVLKPGGKLIFIEHVAAPRGTLLRAAQNALNPFNRLIADGCNCNRETWATIQQAGFNQVEISNYRMNGTLKFHAPHIMGFAVK